MPVDYAYPPQLAQFLRHAWESSLDPAPLLAQPHLDRVLTVAYQASLLRDEDRPVRARIVVAPPTAFDPLQGPPRGLHPLVFDEPVPYTPDQLRRLAVAAKYSPRPGRRVSRRRWLVQHLGHAAVRPGMD